MSADDGRRFVMARVNAGDYICPSNNAAALWRFTKYQDGSAHGLQVDYEVRDFWMARYTPMPQSTYIDLGRLDDMPWTEAASMLASRAEAIAVMVSRTTPASEGDTEQ